MIIASVSVQNFRAHKTRQVQLSPETTIITGLNGVGKTSIVEAIYIALQGSSFKGSDTDAIRNGAEWYRIDIEAGDQTRTIKYQPQKETQKKQFIIDGKKHYRLPQSQKYPIVLFEPDDLQLFTGSPARRRRYIDQLIANIEPSYNTTLRRYERALRQRNQALKQNRPAESLFAWNVMLSTEGAKIISARHKYQEEINRLLQATYQQISGANDDLSIEMPFEKSNTIEQKLLSLLESTIQKDSILGYTSVGPHRHDITFLFNNKPAQRIGSRGESRSYIITLKFIETKIIEQTTGQKPIIILDDIFSELDRTRQQLVTEFMKDFQTIITSVDNITRGTEVKL
jgi:DNA replication and repair protein RecF